MRIGTYNIFSFRGFPGEEAAKELGEPNSPERIKHFTGVFRELDCDILALQEGGVAAKTIQAIADGLGVSVATFTSPAIGPGISYQDIKLSNPAHSATLCPAAWSHRSAGAAVPL